MKTATLALSLFTLTAACLSQQPAKDPAKAPFVIEAGAIELTTLIDRCATYLDWNILLNPQEMTAGPGTTQIRLQKAVSTDASGCEEFLAGLLSRNAMALTFVSPQGPTYEVISMHGPRGREVTNRAVQRTPEQVLARPDLKVVVMTTVQLQHINATVATNAMRPFFASTGAPTSASLSVGNVGNSSGMLLLGMQDQVAQAIRVLRACDVPPPAPSELDQSSWQARMEALERRLKTLEDKLAETGRK